MGHDGRHLAVAGEERTERAGAEGVVGEDDPARARHSSTSLIT